MTIHKGDVNPGFRVGHRLSPSGLGQTNARSIIWEIAYLPAVESVSVYTARQTAKITYDGAHHKIDEMIAFIRKHGADICSGWWNRAKLGWLRRTDSNMRDNAAHKANCCSEMPTDFKAQKK